MAITARSATTATTNSGTTLAITLPSDIVIGDLILVGIGHMAGTGGTITAPAGWTGIGSQLNSTTVLGAQNFYKVAESGDASSSVTFNSGSGSNTKISAIAVAYGGVDPADLIHGESGQVNASSVNIVCPAVTAASPAVRIAFGSVAYGTAIAVTSTWTQSGYVSTGGGGASSRNSSAQQRLFSTTANPPSVTMVANDAAVNIGVQIVLKEAPITPDAPTGGTVNDTADTFGFTETPTYATGDHEYRINAGSWTTATNPISVGDIAVAIGSLEVRVKALGGNNAGNILTNATAFTVASSGGNGGTILEARHTFLNTRPLVNQPPFESTGWQQTFWDGATLTAYGLGVTTDPGASSAQPIGTGFYTLPASTGVLLSGSNASILRACTELHVITRTGKEIKQVEWTTANANASTTSRFIVKIGTEWYAYGSANSQSSASGSTRATAFATHQQTYNIVLSHSTNQWFPVSGTDLSLGTGAELPSGDIVGYGIYFTKTLGTSDIRFDDVWILTESTTLPVPAKPTNVAITAGSLSWTNTPTYTDHEYTTNAGLTYTTGTTGISLTDSYYAAYQVGVRVKSTGANTYSETTWNTSPYYSFSGLQLKETFPYGGTTDITKLGWRMAHSSTGTIGTASMHRNDIGSPELASYDAFTNFLNASGFISEGTSSTSKFYHTTYTIDISRTSFEISRIRYKTANSSSSSTGWLSRAAVKIGTTWYVYKSDDNANVQASTSSNTQSLSFSSYTLQVDETPTGTNWYELTFVDNTSMSVSSTAVNLPVGNITGVGVYYHRTSAASTLETRLDDFELYTETTGGGTPPRRIIFIT